ncbi:MAG TPA: hypothetical protein VHM90_09520, partial [Phycisphaerae bacterium]|nr:hypothetical protein [Phycisphaerae bacterium]
NFSNQTEFPGYGIHSIAELLVPLAALRQLDAPAATTLAERDWLWGDIASCLTVRSDTFVVYAYMEALRQNPHYTGAFDNKYDWYATNYGTSVTPPTGGVGVTDDPNLDNYGLLRVARRRWVAIVDRSYANFSRYQPNLGAGPPFILDPRFTQPRIVAQKDLPR